MSENIVQEGGKGNWHFEHPVIGIQESEGLEIESGATMVHSPDNPSVPISKGVAKRMKIQCGITRREAEKGDGDGHEGEKADKVEDEHVQEKEGPEMKKKKSKVGDKRQRPADEVKNGEEQVDSGTEAKKAKIAEVEQEKPGKKKRQAKTQAKAKIQETAPKKRGPGRPRKSSGTKKKADEIEVEGEGEGEQKQEAMKTPKVVN